MKNATRLLCAAGLTMGLAGFATGAAAQDHAPGNVYNHTEFKTGLYAGGGLGWGWSDHDDDWSWKGLVGWRLNEYLAVQGFYADLPPISNGAIRKNVETFGVEGLVSFPLSQEVAIYGKGGLHNYNDFGSSRDTLWLGGAGAEFALANNWSVRTEWTHYNTRTDSVDDIGVQLIYGF